MITQLIIIITFIINLVKTAIIPRKSKIFGTTQKPPRVAGVFGDGDGV